MHRRGGMLLCCCTSWGAALMCARFKTGSGGLGAAAALPSWQRFSFCQSCRVPLRGALLTNALKEDAFKTCLLVLQEGLGGRG